MRRGFVFTLDALLSLILVTLFITGIVAVTENSSKVYSTYMRSQSKELASSTLLTLRTVPLNELVDPGVIQGWIQNGTLNLSLVNPDMSPLDIVSTYWATAPIYPSANLRHKAEVILGYILNKTLQGYNYELLINNYTSPYLRKLGSNYSRAPDVSPATLIMSGYAYNQTPRGYMARAYLTRASYIREDLIGWSRVLAGAFSASGYSNSLDVRTSVDIPAIDSNSIYEANGNFVHRFLEQEDVYINGQLVPLSNTEPNAPDLTPYLEPGINTVRMYFHDSQYWGPYYRYTIGIGSGTTMYVKYKTTSTNVNDPGLVKIYNVTSEYTGFMYLLENFVPGNITSIDIKLKVEGVQVVRLYYGLGSNLYLLLEKTVSPDSVQTVEFNDTEIRSALDAIGITYDNLSKMVFDFVLGIDAEYYTTDNQFHYGGASYVSYSCPVSDCGGERTRILFGYPDSYVKISYVSRTVVTKYSIPISVYVDYNDPTYSGYTGYHCGVSTYKTLSVTYNLPPMATPWYADFWVGYCFDESTTQSLYENGNEFYSGPNGVYSLRIAYSKMYPWMMQPGTNTFTATLETGVDNGGTSFREGATRGIIKYFIQAYAGYGDVFPKYIRDGCSGYNITYYWVGDSNPHYILAGDSPYCDLTAQDLLDGRDTYAVDDAIVRLFNNLGGDGTQSNPILVELPSTVQIEIASMGNIPGLFKPIQITLRVWRED